MENVLQHIERELSKTADEAKVSELKRDRDECMSRKARLEKSLRIEQRIRGYARESMENSVQTSND